MKNGVYFIVIAFLFAELFKILVYANWITSDVTLWTQNKWGYRMVNPRLCETIRPLFKNPRPNYKSSRLGDCSTCSEPEIPRLLF